MTAPTDHDAVASTFRHLVHDLLNGNNNGNSSHHYDEFCGGGNNLYNLAHERITWESVKLITTFSFVLWATCLIGYELFRRDPIVGKYVYDRKRLVQPDRSPPPLMLSRSLWLGRKEDDVTQTRTKENCCSFSCCCRVKPAMLEIIFLTLDTNYVRYSRLANSARSRREDDMSYYTCCRTGWYHNNCWNNYRGRRRGRRRASSSSSKQQQQQQQQQQTDATTANTTTATTTTTTTTIDEDGYEFYPEYDNTYSHLYNGDDAQYSRGGSLDEYTMVVDAISKRRAVVVVGDDGNGDLGGGEEKEEEDVEQQQQQQVPPPTQNLHKRLTTYDLFPEDDPRKFRKAFAKTRSEYNYSKSQGVGKSGSLCIFPNDDDDDDDDKDKYDEENDHVGEVKDDGEEKDEWVPIDWNSKNNDNGIVKNGLVMQTNSSENSTRNHKPSTTSTTTNNNMDDAKVIYPSRLKRLFLPLGFNSWVSVYDHLHDFLLLHELFRVCRYMNLMSPLSPMRIRRDNIFGRRRKTKIMLHDIPVTPPGKELSDEEKELLRCAGLDVYLFIRFVRFGFDATFYPFLLALVAAMPLYHTKAEFKRMDGTYDITHGFFTLTISQIPAGSGVIYWITFLTVTLYLGILRRLWMEWEIFIKLRHDFLAKGDTYYYKRPTYLQKYQNTCIVECVPKSHRSDTNLKDVFESLFPGEIEHAEMIIDTSTLEGILHKRRALIEKYDNVIAKYRYSQWLAKNKHTAGQLPPEPKKPMYKVGGGRCSRTKQDAIEYYNNEIIKLEELAAKEYDRIVETRMKCHRSSLMKPSGFEEMKQLLDSPVNSCEDGDENALTRLYTLLIPSKVRQAFGEESEFFTGTGVVTFKSIAKKEFGQFCLCTFFCCNLFLLTLSPLVDNLNCTAIQSNLSGHPHWMVTEDAPDPRDLFWSNIGVDVRNIESRKVLVQIFLFIGLLVWSYFVGFIQQLVERTIQSMDEYGVVITVIKESYGGAIRDGELDSVKTERLFRHSLQLLCYTSL